MNEGTSALCQAPALLQSAQPPENIPLTKTPPELLYLASEVLPILRNGELRWEFGALISANPKLPPQL